MSKLGNISAAMRPSAGARTAGGGVVAQPQNNPLGNLFPEKGSRARNDMIMGLLQSGLQSARGADPVIAGLAPIMGALIGGRADADFQKAESARNQAITENLLGHMMGNPKAVAALEVLNNPDAPDHLRSIATSQLASVMKPPKGRGRSAGQVGYRSPPSNTDALLTRLLYSSMDPESEGGATITPAEQSRIDTVRTARSRGNTPSADPFTQFLDGDAPAATPAAPTQPTMPLETDDPLGILSLPPA